jgi:hypothetical protein
VQEWLDAHSEGLHRKLESHGKNHAEFTEKLLNDMPDHDTIMQGVHSLLSEHMSDHKGHIMASINTLPLPPDEKILLQAVENMQEASLSQILEAMEELKKQCDFSRVERQLEDHTEGLHRKLDSHAKNHEGLAEQIMNGVPDHAAILEGVHGLLGDHIGDHSDKVMSSISSLPLPPDEKVMLQAIENMQEVVLAQILEAIGKLKSGSDVSNVVTALDNLQMQVSVSGNRKVGTSESGSKANSSLSSPVRMSSKPVSRLSSPGAVVQQAASEDDRSIARLRVKQAASEVDQSIGRLRVKPLR